MQVPTELIQHGMPDTVASRAVDPVRIRRNAVAGPMGLISDKRTKGVALLLNIYLFCQNTVRSR